MIYQSDGVELLAGRPETAREISKITGVTENIISLLKSGKKLAPSENDKIKFGAIGIPVEAWALREGVEAAAGSGDGAASPADHLRIVRRWREKLQQNGALPKDVTAALEAERRAVELVHKSAKDNFSNIIEAIVETLAPFPEAREAVQQRLKAEGL